MSSSNFDFTAMTSSSDVTSDVSKVLRLNTAKTDSRYFGFRWRKRNSEDYNARNTTVNDISPENSNTKISNGFLRNIKKRWRIKNFGLCGVKQKIISIDPQRDNDAQISSPSDETTRQFVDEVVSNERVISVKSDVALSNDDAEFSEKRDADVCWESYASLEDQTRNGNADRKRNNDAETRLDGGINSVENNNENGSLIVGRVIEDSAKVVESADNGESNDCRAKVNLSEELLKLSKYGWYWGPISGDEADSKLVSEPDGAFLVRDSSDHRYLLTLSFKSSGRLLHARMEHTGGLFSLCNQSDNAGFPSVAELIDHSMNSSQSAVFCYSRPKYPGCPSFPVRLTKPVSRFTQVRSLQYLCRFVIRQNTRLDNIHKLPLPKTIKGYIEEAHY